MIFRNIKNIILWIVFLSKISIYATYTPSYISNFKSGTITEGFYYSGWMDTMKANMGSEALVRQSFAPSAMVDANGDLYCIYVSGFDTTRGVMFRLTRCSFDTSNNVTFTNQSFYPWYETSGFSMLDAGKTAGSSPYTETFKDDAKFFKEYGHNGFMPCVLQEPISYDNKVCIYVPFLTGKFFKMNSIEGMMYFDFKKNSIDSISNNVFYNANHCDVRRIHDLRPRYASTSYKYNVEQGNYTGWHDGGYVHVNFIALGTYAQNSTGTLCHQYNTNYKTYTSFTKTRSGHVMSSLVCPRYIYYDGYVYGLLQHAGKIFLMQQSKASSSTSLKLDFSDCFRHLDTYGQISTYTAYNYDFFITDDGMVGVLGFRPTTGDGSSSKTALTSTYNWSYVSWGMGKMCLVLTTCPINASTVNPAEYSSNVIYTTDINSFTGSVSVTNTSASNLYRLYLNTHKICYWKSPKTNNQYIVYAYCYPGKSTQLYLGYDLYQKSDNKLNLLTKIELKKENQESGEEESFGNFTTCSRIISMDVRNNHLWITWMNNDNTKYYYFHILMNNLIQEEQSINP